MKTIRLLIGIVIFGLVSSSSFAGSHFACEDLFGRTPSAREAITLRQILKDNRGTSNNSTVQWIDHSDHRVIFYKDKNDVWLSRHIALDQSLTAEGDLRLPIFLMGPELASEMGFAVHEYGEKIEVAIPDADLLASDVAAINQSLHARKLEPITYLPVRTGYITVEDGIDLLLSAKGDYLIHFPYADEHTVLVPHEAAFHLGAMMLPARVTSRARLLTKELMDLVSLIKSRENDLGPKAKEVIDQIMLERSFELDAGLASNVTTPAHARRDNDMKSYAEILPKMTEKSWGYMQRAMEYLTHPRLQPAEAVLTRIQVTTGLDLKEFIHGDNSGFIAASILDQGIGKKVSLNVRESQIMKEIAKQFMAQPHLVVETVTPRELAEYYIGNLDQRILDILAAFH